MQRRRDIDLAGIHAAARFRELVQFPAGSHLDGRDRELHFLEQPRNDPIRLLNQREKQMPDVNFLLPLLTGKILGLLDRQRGLFGKGVKIDIHTLVFA